jgi:hypothetical protein
MQIIDSELLRRVYAKVHRFGQQVEISHYFLSGIYANKSADGFVITLSDKNNSISLNFDQQLNSQLACNHQTHKFLKKMKTIDRRYP